VIEYGVAGRPAPGEAHSGDGFVVQSSDESTLVAVMDGLGHGPEAAEAAELAAEFLSDHADQPLVSLIEGCHRALRKTRGVVLAAARLEEQGKATTWLGVGNVDARVFRSGPRWGQSDTLVMRGGVVGYQIPALRPRPLHIQDGDLLVMATDGIQSSYQQALSPMQSVQTSADRVLAGYGNNSDDALVLVSRLIGASS
jgi:serine/threonine protein phosphatase PrpC